MTRIRLILLTGVLFAIQQALLSYASADWIVMTVDSTDNVGRYSSIAIDSSNRPHISYTDVTDVWNHKIKYAGWNGTSWTIHTIDDIHDHGPYGSSIALDSSNRPQIAYNIYRCDVYGCYVSLKYAYLNGSSWVIQTIGQLGVDCHVGGIAVDSSDFPNVGYTDGDNHDIKYTYWNGTGWVPQTVETDGQLGFTVSSRSVVLDSSNRPHLAYVHWWTPKVFNNDLKYARRDGTSWTIQTVVAAGEYGGNSCIALDSHGIPHIAYQVSTNGINHAYWDGTNWNVETIDGSGTNPRIAIDSANRIHVVYNDAGNLKYACWNGGSWKVETVESGVMVDGSGSIDVDSSGDPHISYRDATNGDLRYARFYSTPPISVNGGAQYTGSRTVTLDLSLVGGTEMSFANSNPSWSPWEPYATSKSWTLSPGEGSKEVYTRFRDCAGNVTEMQSQEIVLDTTPPSGSVYIKNNTTYTNSRSVTLTLSSSDNLSGISLMMLANDSSFTGAYWEDYSTSRVWTLSPDDGRTRVYAMFEDGAGNRSETYWDDIILDMIPPLVSITSPSLDSSVRGEVSIGGTASDENFGSYIVEYGEGIEPTSWTEIDSSNSQVANGTLAEWNTTVLKDGSHTLRLTAWDLAGNWAQKEVRLRVDNHPPKAVLIAYPAETVAGNTPKVAVTFTWTGFDPDGVTLVERLVYQYKLEGHLDYQNWSDWSFGTNKTYMLPSGSYAFKLRAKDEAGNYPEENEPETATCVFIVSLPIIVYPNPCYPIRGQVITVANVPQGSDVILCIFDNTGSLVRSAGESEATVEGGSQTVVWDCTNDKGEFVARGIYVYLISGAKERKIGKIAIIR